MSEWVSSDISKPPASHSVLLYVVQFHEDGKSIFDDNIYSGFYGDEDLDTVGFYAETHEGYTYIQETTILKVIAWTLLPRKPYKGIFNGDWDG